MFYFASDNPLAPNIVPQLKAIKNAGFHRQVNVIAQFDPAAEGMPTQIFDVNLVNKLTYPGELSFSPAGNDPYVRSLVMDKLWEPAKTLTRCEQRLRSTFPPFPGRNIRSSNTTQRRNS